MEIASASEHLVNRRTSDSVAVNGEGTAGNPSLLNLVPKGSAAPCDTRRGDFVLLDVWGRERKKKDKRNRERKIRPGAVYYALLPGPPYVCTAPSDKKQREIFGDAVTDADVGRPKRAPNWPTAAPGVLKGWAGLAGRAWGVRDHIRRRATALLHHHRTGHIHWDEVWAATQAPTWTDLGNSRMTANPCRNSCFAH